METRLKCNKPNCYNNEMHRHFDSLDWLAGHERYMPSPVDTATCNWVTANKLTDYEAVPCTTVATHKVNDAVEPGLTYLCLAHADLYRTINHTMPERLNNGTSKKL